MFCQLTASLLDPSCILYALQCCQLRNFVAISSKIALLVRKKKKKKGISHVFQISASPCNILEGKPRLYSNIFSYLVDTFIQKEFASEVECNVGPDKSAELAERIWPTKKLLIMNKFKNAFMIFSQILYEGDWNTFFQLKLYNKTYSAAPIQDISPPSQQRSPFPENKPFFLHHVSFSAKIIKQDWNQRAFSVMWWSPMASFFLFSILTLSNSGSHGQILSQQWLYERQGYNLVHTQRQTIIHTGIHS